jgi:hypothetical protein
MLSDLVSEVPVKFYLSFKDIWSPKKCRGLAFGRQVMKQPKIFA